MLPPRVSVVVPVYNALPYLSELLDSLAAQDIGKASFEVIAVDDGSTDGSGAVLDQFAAARGNVTVIHQANSGAPGGPCNVGLRAAAGTYVFFAGADDVLGVEALRRLAAFADEHESDIVIPKLTPLDGRALPQAVYKKTRIDADLVTAFGTLFSQKLYRRGFLNEHGIRFPEGRRNLEDGVFNAQAFVRARRISILTGYDFYFLRARSDGRNISFEQLDPAVYTGAVAQICRTVRAHLDPATASDVIADLYCRKCLNRYHRGMLERHNAASRSEWVMVHRQFAQEFVTPGMEARLPSPYRERSALVRCGDVAGLLALGAAELREKALQGR